MAVVDTDIIAGGGGDYSTIAAWAADLDNSGIYSSGDDAVGHCSGNFTNTDVDLWMGGTVGLTRAMLTADVGERHDGTAGTGARLTSPSTQARLTASYGNGGVFPIFEYLELDGGGVSTARNAVLGKSSATGTIAVHRCIVHDYTAANWLYLVTLEGTWNADCWAIRNIIYDFENTATFGADTRAIQRLEGGVSRVINNTVFKGRSPNNGPCKGIFCGGDGAGTHWYENNISMDVDDGDFIWPGGTVARAGYNMSSDATADDKDTTGALISKTPANQFVSTTAGSEDLHLKTGADAIDAGRDYTTSFGIGTLLIGANEDIDGFDIDADGGTWDMGADELEATGWGRLIAMQRNRLVFGV